MQQTSRHMPRCKNIALVAHDNMKQCLLEWACHQQAQLSQHKLFATGTTVNNSVLRSLPCSVAPWEETSNWEHE